MPPRQLGKALLVEDQGDGHGAARGALLGQDLADVVDGKILFAERDDRLANAIARRGRPRPLTGCDEEGPGWILAELVAENAEAAGCVPEARGGLLRRQTLDEVGAQGFVLPMRGVRRFKKPLG